MTTNACSVQMNGANHRLPVMAKQQQPLDGLGALAVTTRCHRCQEICHPGQAAEYWYRLISGVARLCTIRPDGRRQIVDLLLPGDFFGFSAGEEYDFAVEAVVEGTTVISYPRRRLEILADNDPRLAREIRKLTFDAIARLQAQLLILGRMTAVEKVGSFLLEMADRLSDGHADRVVLPISRYDIADYLGISVETVSRSMTDLKHRGVIALAGTRRVRIVNRDALEDADASMEIPIASTAHKARPCHVS